MRAANQFLVFARMELSVLRQKFSDYVHLVLLLVGVVLVLMALVGAWQWLMHHLEITIPAFLVIGGFAVALGATWLLIRVVRHAWTGK